MEKHDTIKHIADAFEKEVGEAFRIVRDSDLDEKLKVEVEEELRGLIEGEIRGRAKKLARGKLLEIKRKRKLEEEERKQEWFQRFSLAFRAQHVVLFVSVILLVLTGLPLKFPDSWWAEFLFSTLGAFAPAKFVHRVGAGGLILVSVFHAFYVFFLREGRRMFADVLPRPGDALCVIANLKYFLGISERGARFGRFSYVEKFDYWAVYWGVVIMVCTGAALWLQDAFMRVMPKYAIDIMKEAHSDEALLATLAIVIWHFYNVHLNPGRFPGTLLWWHGKISKEEMIRDHPLEYERIMNERLKEIDNEREAGGEEDQQS